MRRDQEGPYDDGPEPAKEEAGGQAGDRGVAKHDVRGTIRKEPAEGSEQESSTTSE